jgi:hypothetical protein
MSKVAFRCLDGSEERFDPEKIKKRYSCSHGAVFYPIPDNRWVQEFRHPDHDIAPFYAEVPSLNVAHALRGAGYQLPDELEQYRELVGRGLSLDETIWASQGYKRISVRVAKRNYGVSVGDCGAVGQRVLDTGKVKDAKAINGRLWILPLDDESPPPRA